MKEIVFIRMWGKGFSVPIQLTKPSLEKVRDLPDVPRPAPKAGFTWASDLANPILRTFAQPLYDTNAIRIQGTATTGTVEFFVDPEVTALEA